jgi:hypothetical protein
VHIIFWSNKLAFSFNVQYVLLTISDADPGSGVFFIPGSRIG